MKRTLLIINANSGSANAVDGEQMVSALQAAGLDIRRQVKLPEEDLPSKDAVEDGKFEVVAILSGDGTISSLCANLSGWDGAILALPGGTMNLLSRRLHGDYPLPALLQGIASTPLDAEHIAVIKFGDREILTGLTVGPCTRWGEVREGIRQGDMSTLTDIVPAAWSETLADNGVWLGGGGREAYAGIFIEPVDANALLVMAFRANSITDMVGHGIAWLRRDFREGPRSDLGTMATVTVLGDDTDTGLLIDGELEAGQLPLTCSAGLSSLKFIKII